MNQIQITRRWVSLELERVDRGREISQWVSCRFRCSGLGRSLRNQVDVQNSFCTYIWHPVQESGWFLGYAIGYASGDAVVDGIVDGAVDEIGYGIGDAAVYLIGDAGGDKAVDSSVYGTVSGSVNVCEGSMPAH
jgi:hypothetical protein